MLMNIWTVDRKTLKAQRSLSSYAGLGPKTATRGISAVAVTNRGAGFTLAQTEEYGTHFEVPGPDGQIMPGIIQVEWEESPANSGLYRISTTVHIFNAGIGYEGSTSPITFSIDHPAESTGTDATIRVTFGSVNNIPSLEFQGADGNNAADVSLHLTGDNSEVRKKIRKAFTLAATGREPNVVDIYEEF